MVSTFSESENVVILWLRPPTDGIFLCVYPNDPGHHSQGLVKLVFRLSDVSRSGAMSSASDDWKMYTMDGPIDK